MNSFFIIRCTILQRAGSYNSEVGEDNHLNQNRSSCLFKQISKELTWPIWHSTNY